MCKKDFDTIKNELKFIEELSAIKNNPLVKSTVLSVINSVPVIGGLIDSGMDTLLTHFQEIKRKELIEYILSDVNITSEHVNDVEFIINFAKTLEAVNRLPKNEKVQFFANLLKNSYFVDEKSSCDEFDENIEILTRLSYREIRYMQFLLDYQNEKAKKEKPYFREFGKTFADRFNLGQFDYLDIFQKLSYTGFVQPFYRATKPTISRNSVHNEYDEEYSISNIEVDIEYFWITDLFINFTKQIGEPNE